MAGDKRYLVRYLVEGELIDVELLDIKDANKAAEAMGACAWIVGRETLQVRLASRSLMFPDGGEVRTFPREHLDAAVMWALAKAVR